MPNPDTTAPQQAAQALGEIIAKVTREHVLSPSRVGLPMCQDCEDEWPCGVRNVLDALAAAREELAELQKDYDTTDTDLHHWENWAQKYKEERDAATARATHLEAALTDTREALAGDWKLVEQLADRVQFWSADQEQDDDTVLMAQARKAGWTPWHERTPATQEVPNV